MRVVALQTWSNGTITMDEKSVADIDDTLADSLIEQGICANAETYFGTGGGGGGGVLVVHDVNGTLDKTWQEIRDSMTLRGAVLVGEEPFSAYVVDAVVVDAFTDEHIVSVGQSGTYACMTPDDYPVFVLDNGNQPILA